MARLDGLITGDVVKEFLGPHTGRNYFSTGAPAVDVQMFGGGSVQMQTNTSYILSGERVSSPSGQVPINFEKIPDPTTWVDLGGVISNGSLVSVAPLAQPNINFIRAIVVAPGDGNVAIATHWDKG